MFGSPPNLCYDAVIETLSTINNTMLGCTVGCVFGNHRSHLNSDHAEFSDLIDHIDHRESDSDLRFTVNPDADNRPVGVDRVMTSSIPINRKHSLNDSHVQLITSTMHIADLFKDNRSHPPPPHV